MEVTQPHHIHLGQCTMKHNAQQTVYALLLRHYTGCGRNNSHILKAYKNQTTQGTQKILLFIKSTYDAIFFQTLLKITSLKCRPLLMTNSRSRSRKLSMALRVIAGGMAATSCCIASFNCSIVPG